MIGIAEDSVRSAHSSLSHNLLRPAIAELVSCGREEVMGGMESHLIPTEPSQTYP